LHPPAGAELPWGSAAVQLQGQVSLSISEDRPYSHARWAGVRECTSSGGRRGRSRSLFASGDGRYGRAITRSGSRSER
jgi:hypothetical protein